MSENHHDDDQTQSFVTLSKGMKIGHYTIISMIGAGGMGEVYLAEDTQLDRKVALKFLPPHLCQDEDCRARFTREAKAAAKLDHPNIVPVFEVGEFQKRPFYAMAHIEGKSLRDVIKVRKRLVSEAIQFTTQILEGLHKAHESGVVHRDIKPGNIIIDNENRPRLLDFGLATVVGEDKLTKTGSTLGTVGYMSPEQVSGKKVDHRSDIFSVGVVLYEMLTGHRPFEGDNDIAISRSITDTTPDPISRHIPDVSDSIQRVIDRALAKDPGMRYQHADDFCADLKRLQSGISVDSVKPERKMLAILPFENLGPAEDEYFADGIIDEIMSRLSGIEELGVIAHTSSVQYKGTQKSVRQISEELGVVYILEGSVRWQKRVDKPDLVRITPKLIQTSDATQLWAENYDRELSEVFQVQTDIALKIINQLRISILPEAQVDIKRQPTKNMEAYNYYLRGKYYLYKLDMMKPDLTSAIAMFRKAIELDHNFINAYAQLAKSYLGMYHQHEQIDKNIDMAGEMIFKAIEINPNSSELYIVLSQYYRILRNHEKSLDAIEKAKRLGADSGEVNRGLANSYIRMGKFDESLELRKRAFQISPRDVRLAWNLAYQHMSMRYYADAEKFYKRSIALDPEQATSHYHRAWNYFLWKGDIDSSLKCIDNVSDKDDPYIYAYGLYTRIRLRLCRGEYQESLKLISEAPDRLATHRYDNRFCPPKTFLKGLVMWISGNSRSSQSQFEEALTVLKKDIVTYPENIRAISSLGIAFAGVGNKAKAIEYGSQAVAKIPLKKDAIFGTLPIFDLILIYLMVGEYDLALDRIEQLLIHPCDEFSTVTMRIDPIWDPLRDHPRFQVLIEKYDITN